MIYRKYSRILFSVLIIGTGVAYGSGESFAVDLNHAKEKVQQLIYEISGKDSATLKFDKGSSKLTASQIAELKTMLNAIRDKESVKEIIVVSYADFPYPIDQNSDLPRASQTLATARADAVKAELENIGGQHVRIINMALKAKWYDKAFVTKEAEVKQEASVNRSDANLDDSFYEALGQRLKSDGGAGSVVVVVRHNGRYSKLGGQS